MTDLVSLTLKRPLYVWLLMLTCLGGGFWGIETVGRLEDPPFPIKTAFIITPYPGASAVEVEQEVTDVVESALLELPYVDKMISRSVPGRSEVQVELHERYGPEDIPQIWDELRRRVAEAALLLPPEALQPRVEDDYGDVFGIVYAITTPGYDIAQQQDVARTLKTALKRLAGVAKVSISGLPEEAVYVEIAAPRLRHLGLPVDQVFASIAGENRRYGAGSLRFGERRIRIAPERAFDNLAAIGNLHLALAGTSEVLRLDDLATISRRVKEQQTHRVRYQGRPAIALGISVTKGANVVDVGTAVAAQLAQALQQLPVGIEIHPIYEQHVAVAAAIQAFLINLALSVGTVVTALLLFMGLRAGLVVGSVLLLTVLGTLAVMALFGIELQRISLGALMIAMGMLVDNAIVVAEGLVVGLGQGLGRLEAASRAVRRTRWPLLGATVIGILAFAPIGLSDDNSGYFLRTLFQVVCIALLLSWILAITVVPVLGARILKSSNTAVSEATLYRGIGYGLYRVLLRAGLERPWLATFLLLLLAAVSFATGQWLKVGFFPSNNTPLAYVDLYLPQGTDLDATTAAVARVEALLREAPEVQVVSSFIGRGAPRFTATARPEQPNPAYALLVVQLERVELLPTVMQRFRQQLRTRHPELTALVRRMEFSPTGHYRIEARFSGPDPTVLRALGEQALARYEAHQLTDLRLDWRQREIELVPRFDEARASLTGITRADVAQALAFATDGIAAGLYRDGDKLLPILLKAPANESSDSQRLMDRQLYSQVLQSHVPMAQVVQQFEITSRDNLIWRRDHQRTLTAQANPIPGKNPNETFQALRGAIETIALPPGYTLTWGGEYESSQEANELLISKLPVTFGSMALLSILMFGTLRQAMVIWLTVPLCAGGFILALVATDLSFTFPAFLGFLSLIGMLIKNCIVLIDEIDKRFSETDPSLEQLLLASVSRLRPVTLTAGTTIAGMTPLIADAFFREMAVGIMGGLAFATVLTLFAVPIWYRLAFGRSLDQPPQPAIEEPDTPLVQP